MLVWEALEIALIGDAEMNDEYWYHGQINKLGVYYAATSAESWRKVMVTRRDETQHTLYKN